MSPDRDVVAEETVSLRAEVREALAAWEADIDDYELERDYFDKMDALDRNLAERGLERGEDIDQEIPLREFQTQEPSTLGKIRDRIDRNEDGMFRFPWHKEQPEPVASHHPNWHANDDGTAYHWSDGNGVDVFVTREHRNRWHMTYALDHESPTFHADLGKTRHVHTALDRAELVIEDARQQVNQTYEDMRTVVNLAKEVEDRTPEEQASIDRLQEAIDQGPPPGALDPAADWLDTFNQETQEREQQRDQDQDQGY
jgi:hypothetical protein